MTDPLKRMPFRPRPPSATTSVFRLPGARNSRIYGVLLTPFSPRRSPEFISTGWRLGSIVAAVQSPPGGLENPRTNRRVGAVIACVTEPSALGWAPKRQVPNHRTRDNFGPGAAQSVPLGLDRVSAAGWFEVGLDNSGLVVGHRK